MILSELQLFSIQAKNSICRQQSLARYYPEIDAGQDEKKERKKEKTNPGYQLLETNWASN